MPNDIEMERTNTAQAQTNLVAEGHFSDQFVFAVGVTPGVFLSVNGFSAQGYNGGTGVTGFGGDLAVVGTLGREGVGVSGQGGKGGTGVSGKGGAGGKGVDPGVGVKAVGGLSDRTRGSDAVGGDNRSPNAPGVVAISGGSELLGQSTTLAETANVGVFGQGGDQVENTRHDGEHPNFVVGPPFAGAGVIGRGGAHLSNSGHANWTPDPVGGGAAEIVGIAGGTKPPNPDQYEGVGVFGISNSGAQLRLFPILKSPHEVPQGKARIGDLLVTITPRDEPQGNVDTAQLWFCFKIDSNGTPTWLKVAPA